MFRFFRLPEVFVPAIAAGEFIFSDENHVFEFAAERVQAPARGSSASFFEVATGAAFAMDHFPHPFAPVVHGDGPARDMAETGRPSLKL
ncbi:hypothetical protein NITHO_40002 [Nitrolancea hollandica Lb]|uniref:Uncharacterized protein n=1 Tax=Nitrolancea hollandica Lb TaxID=1129897 RepID=I4EJE6_9BACT|nr:hypothetical protein NITHO_40002 [Nitrolancea hollandica Lb]